MTSATPVSEWPWPITSTNLVEDSLAILTRLDAPVTLGAAQWVISDITNAVVGDVRAALSILVADGRVKVDFGWLRVRKGATMTPAEILATIKAAQLLISAGVATAQQIAAWIKAVRGQAMTEEELNAVLDTIQDDAKRRKALADADAEQAKIDAQGQN